MPRCPVCSRRLRGGATCPGDGTAAAAERARDPGPRPAIAGFELGELLGVGGAGAVWAARGRDGPESDAAIKVAHGATELWRARFAREADALAALGAPHAPRLLVHGSLDGRPWIAMERMAGTSLAGELADMAAPPSLATARAIADAVLVAVEAAHEHMLVHRDLKPENLFIRRDRALATLIDFGLATVGAAAPIEAAGWALGTLGYMAPEVLAGGAGDARADVYALGAVLYELFTLRAPFAGDAAEVQRAHLTVRPPPPGLLAAIPRALDELILSCLAKDPDRRPPDAVALRRALAGACEADAVARTDGPRVRSSPDTSRPDAELVALAWLECDAGPARLAAEIARTPGMVVRQHGRTCLAVFAPARSEQPARAALSAATRLLASIGGRAALHVDRVDLRRRDGRPLAAYGDPIDRPDAWLPAEPWTGLLLTCHLVDAIGDLAVVPAGPPGFFALAGAMAAAAPPLVGRADVVEALTASARAGFAAGRPGLALLVGSPGSGKSRLLAEIAAASGDLGAAHILIDGAAQGAGERLDGETLRERARQGPLAVLVDDAHLADDGFLDSLEYATLGGADVPLWVLVAADGPALDQIRPRFGERAARTERLELEPVGDAAMRELAASLLFPADYLPAAVLDRLALLAGGNPGLLSELVRALKREGAVRPRPDRRSHELAIEAIERLPATAAGRWEASRALDALPAELAASARVAAAFGPIIDEGELDAVEDALERDGEGSFFDAGVALRALASRSMVVERGGGSWAFASPLVQDAIYQAIPAAERGRIHEHALRYWRGRGGARALAAVARHAARAGAHAEALVAALSLAESATAASRYVEAERWYSVALLHVSDTATRVRALVGRGRVRWRLDRGPEALSDLAAALALSRQQDDAGRVAAILLDEAMVLDWYLDFDASARKVEEAHPFVHAAGDAGLAARLTVAVGRTCWRQERATEAVDLLAEGAARATDSETRLIALLLSSVALCSVGRLEEAEATYAEAENLATALDDRLHLCVLHVNRISLWAARGDSERGAPELRLAAKIAREVGQPGLERAASHNLAELLHFACRDAEALPVAIRSFELQQRFLARPGPEDALLLCRIAVGLGDHESAARHLSWVEVHAPALDSPPSYSVFYRALDLLERGGAPEAWDAIAADAGVLRPVEQLEIAYLRVLCELGTGDHEAARGTLAAARPFMDEFPMWRARFEGLAAGTPAWGNMQQPPSEPARKSSISSP